MTGPSFDELVSAVTGEPSIARRLVRYLELLERWGRTHNLVSYRTREELVALHVADALAATPFMEAGGRLLDVGSGAGLPGVPLLAGKAGWRGVLLEPRQKRWAFLRTVIRELDLEAEAVRERYERLGAQVERFDLITSRALGGYPALLEWAGAHLHEGGHVFLWITHKEVDSLGDLGAWRVLSSPLPGRDRGVLVRLKKCFT